MKESTGSISVEQMEEDNLRYYTRVIKIKDGQPSVTKFSQKDKAIDFANNKTNIEEKEYAHVYDREQTDEKGNHKRIYTTVPKELQ